jgi:predicted enzyme related to lactoylglutathione lyase
MFRRREIAGREPGATFLSQPPMPQAARRIAAINMEAPVSNPHRTHFERCDPILRVADMPAAVRYYVEVLGFAPAPWGDDNFTSVSRDGATIYLCQGAQGHPGTWVWIGVADVEQLYEELQATGAIIRQPPTNYPWALEMRVEDLDGHVLRIGSDAKEDRPYED